jgi:hypothetical protein
MFVLCSDCSLESIISEQYFLARKANISFMDSNMMPDFERTMVVGLLTRDLKIEEEAYSNIGT